MERPQSPARSPVVDRPLALGEVLAETVRLYGERLWAAWGLGLFVGLVFLVTALTHPAADVAILSPTLALVYGASARVVSGDTFAEAWAQVGVRLPVLLVLALVVIVPFAIAASYLLLLLVAAAWLALTGFSIPVAMLERDAARTSLLQRLGYALRRSLVLARAEYVHAAGVSAALVLLYVLLGTLLAQLLVGFGESGRIPALILVQVVLAPFFFIGLSVLYFEQTARAVSSRGQK